MVPLTFKNYLLKETSHVLKLLITVFGASNRHFLQRCIKLIFRQ